MVRSLFAPSLLKEGVCELDDEDLFELFGKTHYSIYVAKKEDLKLPVLFERIIDELEKREYKITDKSNDYFIFDSDGENVFECRMPEYCF